MSLPTSTKEYYWPKYGALENLTLKESPLPPLASHEVLVKIHAVSLQFRDIMHVATGSRQSLYATKSPDNLIAGSDAAGEVVAVGKDTIGFRVNDRVCVNFTRDHFAGNPTPEVAQTAHGGHIHGVLTQYKAFNPHVLVKIPDHLSFEEASTLPCAALTAYNALVGGPVPVKGGDIVLVQGTGGVAIHGLQFAVASGAMVIATSSSDEKLKIASRLGAKHVINYKKTPDWGQEVLEITRGRGVDHILQVGDADTLEKSLEAVRMNGWIHAIARVGGDDRAHVLSPIILKGCYIRGIQIGSAAQFRDMNQFLATHPEVTRPVIDKVFSFDEALQAYKHLESQAHVGKVVIKVV